MAEFTVTTIIDRPQGDAYAFVSDPANATRWQSGTRYAISNVFEPTDDGAGTRLTQTFQNEVGGLFRFAEGPVVRQLKKEVTADEQALKKLLEAGEAE